MHTQTEGGSHWWPKRRRQASPRSWTSPGFNQIPVGHLSGLRSLERSLRGGGQIGEATVGVGGLMNAPLHASRPCLLSLSTSCLCAQVHIFVCPSSPACLLRPSLPPPVPAYLRRWVSAVRCDAVPLTDALGAWFVPATSCPTKDHSPPPFLMLQSRPPQRVRSYQSRTGKGYGWKDHPSMGRHVPMRTNSSNFCLLC